MASGRNLAFVGGGLIVAALAGGAYLMASSLFGDAPAPEPTVRAVNEPTAGLDAIARYMAPPAPNAQPLEDAQFWLDAMKSFVDASAAGAPVRWRAAQHFCAGQAAWILGDHDDAAASFRQAIALDDTWPPPHVGLAHAQVGLGDTQAARASAQTAQRLAPKSHRPLLAIADAHERDAHPEPALAARRQALATAPQNPALLAEVALGCQRANLRDEATRLAQQASATVLAQIVLADLALDAGDGKAALDGANRAVAAHPQHAYAQLLRADALVLLGDQAAAKAAYLKAFELAQTRKGLEASRPRWKATFADLAQGRLPPKRGPAPPKPPPPPPVTASPHPRCLPGNPICGIDHDWWR